MKMTLGKKILTGFITCGLILCGIAVFTFNNSEKFIDSNAWVEHTNHVLYEFQQIKICVLDAETGCRGYVITRNENFLEPYNNAKIKIYEYLAEVKKLTQDNPVQQKKVEELEKVIARHIEYLTAIIELAGKDNVKARDIITSGTGKRITDEIRKIIADASDTEQDLLKIRKEESDSDARNFNFVFAVLLVVIAMILVSVYFIIITNLRALRKAENETSDKNWLLTGNTELNNKLQGEKEIKELAQTIIGQLTSYLKAHIGAIYLVDGEVINLVGGYAFDFHKNSPLSLKVGQGLVGQAVLEKKPVIFNSVPDDYIKINSGLGNSKPKSLIAFPFLYAGRVKGVIEIGSVKEFSELDLALLNLVSENIGVAVNSSQSRTQLKELLEETQIQSEELQRQQEEMKQLNEELEEQAQTLKQQQEELQQTNEELEEQTQSLEIKNREVESAKEDIEQKTKQLEISSKYKSEFLANMSHELRTPLNSLLILSKDLANNKAGNLLADQIESAEIIYKSGNDLLTLINEVLDLSKIEAGKMSINTEKLYLKAFATELLRDFKHYANQKGIIMEISLQDNLPEFIITDPQRLKQILKNLLSNAIKFTEKGSVVLSFEMGTGDRLIIKVADTGIGIPAEKQMAVFEAFQQADGGTSRKYGGTGLGLSISRELTALLSGEIKLSSEINKGSVFSLILPLTIQAQQENLTTMESTESRLLAIQPVSNNEAYINYPTIDDDRHNISGEDKLLLIIEDDLNFAGILLKQAHKKGFKCLSASTGEDGLILAGKYKPQAIILDLDLPGMKGQRVLSKLKATPALRHIPVHIISAKERSLIPIKEGAVEYLVKPVSKEAIEETFNRIENFANRKIKNLLIIEDDENSRKAMRKLIGNGDVKCYDAETGVEALKMYNETYFDCIVLDIGLPDMTGFELIYKLEDIKTREMPPIIIYTGKELTKEENEELQKYAESIIIKGVKSEERLLDETALFLHRTIRNLPESKQQIIHNLYDKEAVFHKKQILLVDDDMRNVFALTKILKERGMEVVKADNGKVALQMLEQHAGIDLVLMDIMMPEMDGYEAMKRIRLQSKYRNLPIMALTAKAMKEDKQKCLDAGANDYITKPIDVDQLLSLMRVWLSK